MQEDSELKIESISVPVPNRKYKTGFVDDYDIEFKELEEGLQK